MRKPRLFLLPALLLGCNLLSADFSAAAPQTVSGPDDAIPAPTGNGSDSAPSLPTVFPAVPAQTIPIEGASYQAFQAPGDPFRFVCPDPCPIDPQLIFAQYAGFHAVYEKLTGLTGADALPELQPVDIHILDDPKCGNLSDQRVLAYSGWDGGANAFACSYLFEYAEGLGGTPYTAADAARPDWQGTLIHEYLHTLFFGRTPRSAGALHDFVTPIAMFAWLDWSGGEFFCEYHPVTPPGDYGGYLLQELCRRYGFRWEHLARAMIELDTLYASGGGVLDEGFRRPVPDMAQFRDILNRILGTDTMPAFIEACWPAVLFGETYTLPASCTERTEAPLPTAIP